MKNIIQRGLISLGCIFCALIYFEANAAVTTETTCYSSGGTNPVKFEVQTYYDPEKDWSGGFVKYGMQRKPIPIIFVNSNSSGDAAKGESESAVKWLEISGGKISGEYLFKREGAGAGVSGNFATYKNYQKKEKFEFFLDWNTGLDTAGCNWTR